MIEVVCLWLSALKRRNTVCFFVWQPSTQTSKQTNVWGETGDGLGCCAVVGQNPGAPCQPVHLKLMQTPLRRALMSMRLAWERRRGGTNRWPTRPGWGSYLLFKGVFCLHVWDMGISETIVLWVMPGLLWTAWGTAYYLRINSVIIYFVWRVLSIKISFFLVYHLC